MCRWGEPAPAAALGGLAFRVACRGEGVLPGDVFVLRFTMFMCERAMMEEMSLMMPTRSCTTMRSSARGALRPAAISFFFKAVRM